MTAFEYGQDEGEKQVCIPEGVLKGIEDLAEDRTLSDEQLDEILDF